MTRPLRFIPPDSLVEVTSRTLHGRLLLRPSRDLNDIVLGILGRAARKYAVKIVGFAVLSNHAHLLVTPADAHQLASFMNFVNGNLAREAGRLHDWRERFWGRRYRAILVSDEERAQVARLRYLLAQGCKEGLVRSPRHWPGASSTECLLSGRSVEGWWFNRTAESRARRRSLRPGKYDHAEKETVSLTPLPAWNHLGDEEVRSRVAALVTEIEQQTRAMFAAEGRTPSGRRRILGIHPHSLPADSPRSPAPRFHAASRTARDRLEQAYGSFYALFRQAADRLRRGLPSRFPPGSFPPHLPFAAHPRAPS